jgi:hypothetical protein
VLRAPWWPVPVPLATLCCTVPPHYSNGTEASGPAEAAAALSDPNKVPLRQNFATATKLLVLLVLFLLLPGLFTYCCCHSGDHHYRAQDLLRDTLALLAYPEPSISPLARLLQQSQVCLDSSGWHCAGWRGGCSPLPHFRVSVFISYFHYLRSPLLRSNFLCQRHTHSPTLSHPGPITHAHTRTHPAHTHTLTRPPSSARTSSRRNERCTAPLDRRTAHVTPRGYTAAPHTHTSCTAAARR